MADVPMSNRERWGQAAAELTAVRAELKRARRSERGWEARQARQWVLSDEMKSIILTIYMLAEYTMEPVAMYLRWCGSVRGWPNKSAEELEVLVTDIFLEEDAARLAALSNADDPADVAGMQTAQRFVLEWRTVEWSRQRVRGPHIPPSSSLVLQHHDELRVGIPATVRPGCRGASGDARARSWMHRLRQRWGGRHGRLRVRDEPPVEVLQQKARCFFA